jgi:Rod binding domain-containing protein
MSDFSDAMGVNPLLARMPSADIAMMKAKTSGGMTPQKLQQIKEAADDFESMFVSEMLSNMNSTIEPDPMFGGGEAEDTWKGMMNEQYGKEIVKAGGIGLSDAIMSKMIEMQGGDPDQIAAASAPLPPQLQKYITDEQGDAQ